MRRKSIGSAEYFPVARVGWHSHPRDIALRGDCLQREFLGTIMGVVSRVHDRVSWMRDPAIPAGASAVGNSARCLSMLLRVAAMWLCWQLVALD